MGLNIKNPEVENLLEQEIWPTIPKGQLGKRLTRKEEDQILGVGN